MKRSGTQPKLNVRGQAMVEYSMVTHLLMGTMLIVGFNCLGYLMTALDTYYRSVYFVITSPVP